MIASGSADYSIKLWLISDGSIIRNLLGHSNKVLNYFINLDYYL